MPGKCLTLGGVAVSDCDRNAAVDTIQTAVTGAAGRGRAKPMDCYDTAIFLCRSVVPAVKAGLLVGVRFVRLGLDGRRSHHAQGSSCINEKI